MAEHTQTLRVSACRLGPCLPMTFTIDWLKPYHTRRGGVHQKSGGRQLTSHVIVQPSFCSEAQCMKIV